MRKKVLMLALGMMMALSGCGNGGEAGTGEEDRTTGDPSTEQMTAGGEEKKSSEAASGVEDGWTGHLLSEQLGGTDLSVDEDFMIGKVAGKVKFRIGVSDEEGLVSGIYDTSLGGEPRIMIPESEELPSYKMYPITEDRILEKEVVKNLFGDTAREVREDVSQSGGAPQEIIGVCAECWFEIHPDHYVPGPLDQAQMYPAWVDEEGRFLHTYTGTYHDTAYWLTIGYRADEKEKSITFIPDNWGDVAGDPACTIMKIVSDTVWVGSPDEEESGDRKLEEVISDTRNHTENRRELLRSDMQKFAEDMLLLKNPENSYPVKLERKDTERASIFVEGDEAEDAVYDQLLFYPEDMILGQGKMTEAILNGYPGGLSINIGEQSFTVRDGDVTGMNAGKFYVSDAGVMGCDLRIFYDFGECLARQVVILPLESAVEALKADISEKLDTSKLTGQNVQIKDASFDYYVVEAPDEPGACVCLPVWSYTLYCNDVYCVGLVIQNAVDGSIVRLDYTHE